MTAELTTTLEELQRDGVLQRYGERYETTRRWRAARHRASSAPGQPSDRADLKNPIVQALLSYYGNVRAISNLSAHVAVLFAIETAERVPRSGPPARR
jgi:hypothetical protein